MLLISVQRSSLVSEFYWLFSLIWGLEQMLPLEPVGSDRAGGLWLYTNTVKSPFRSCLLLSLLRPIRSTPRFAPSSIPSFQVQVANSGIISSLVTCLDDS